MHYDVIIIGAGSGGYKSAEILADAGKKVLLIEKEQNMGGVCLNWGCIPTKSYIAMCETIETVKNACKMGIDLKYEMNIDFSKVKSRKDRTVKLLTMGLKKTLTGKGIEILSAEAELVDGKIIAGDSEYTFDKLILATGSTDKGLQNACFDHEFILDSKDILSIEHVPEKLIIVGAGVIGVEMATVFSTAGSEVTIVEYLDSILPQSGNTLIKEESLKILKKSGVKCVTGTGVKEIDRDKKQVILDNGNIIEADAVLLSTGRMPVTFEWMKKAGIEMDGKGFIKTDSRCRTSGKGIFAVGDVAGEPMLAHKAYYDAKAASYEILGKGFDKDYTNIPSSVFTLPPISVCGISEDAAKESVPGYRKYEAMYAVNGRAATYDARTGICSIITDEEGRLLGATIIGKESDVMIHELAVLIQNGLNIEHLHNTVHIHPTLSEIIEDAIQ